MSMGDFKVARTNWISTTAELGDYTRTNNVIVSPK